MDMSKKISFGFTKLAKRPSIFVNKIEEKKDVELIDCLEGQSIKVIGAVEETKGPLVIPIKDNAKNLLDRVKDARKNRETKTTDTNEDCRPDSELTLDELAARQLLQEAQTNAKKSDEVKIYTLPLTADNIPLEGEKESTLEDYDNIPINDFGLAMLRGMGWKDGAGIGKNPKTVAKADSPELRPKGLGLGATKMVKIDKPPPAVDKEGKELQLVKGAHAKIIAGKYKGFYCEVQGLDEETGRIIVQTKIKQEVLSLNEFLVIPVTKDEFIKNSKVLNANPLGLAPDFSDLMVVDSRVPKIDKIMFIMDTNNAKYEEYKVKSETKNKEEDKKIKREKIKDEQMSDNDDVQVIEADIKVETISSPEDRKTSRRTPSPRNNRNSKLRRRSNSRSPSRREKERYRSRSRSPARSHKRHKSSKSKHRSRSRSPEYRNQRSKKTESSDSDYDRKDKKKKKKSKKSKKERYDSDSDKDKYRKKKSKKDSKKYDGSDSDSDKKCKYRDKSKTGKSRR